MKIVWEKFKKAISEHHLVNPGDRILLAVSSGPDSMCMLHLFHRLNKTMDDLKLYIAYIDHGLRPKEIKNEIKLVKNIGNKLDMPVYIEKINVLKTKKKIGLEAAARKLRYNTLLKIARYCNCNKIATGHNLNDQAETVIFNLLRSTGQEGLSGIPVVRRLAQEVFIIRPLLKIRRDEIMQYLKANRIRFCTDSTNFSISFARNRIRHTIMPLLEELNPGVYLHLNNLVEWNSIKERYFDGLANRVVKQAMANQKRKNIISLDLHKFLKYNRYIQYKILREIVFKSIKCKLYSKLVNDAVEFINNSKSRLLSGPLEIEKAKDKVYIKFKRQQKEYASRPI